MSFVFSYFSQVSCHGDEKLAGVDVGISRVIAVIICMKAFGNWLAGGLWRSLER